MNICPFMSRLFYDEFDHFKDDPFSGGSTISPNLSVISDGGIVVADVTDGSDTVNYLRHVYHQCLEDKCQMWDSVNTRCAMQVSDTIRQPDNETTSLIAMLEAVLGRESEKDAGNSLLVYLQDILGVNSEKDAGNSLLSFLQDILGVDAEKTAAEGIGSSLLKVLNHMHGAHWHQEDHRCDEIPVGCGSFTFGAGAPYAAKLVNEYMAYEDLDDNGFIYGRDFKIKDSGDKPPMLFCIEDNPAWIDPPIEISWVELKTWSEDPTVNNDPLASYSADPMTETGNGRPQDDYNDTWTTKDERAE